MLSTSPRPAESPGDVTAGLPFVSVVVPTRNRAGVLKDLLVALAAQDYPSDRYEVIVVDNSSTDGTEALVEKCKAQSRCGVTYVRKANDGPAASRNRGAEAAVGEVIAFTDSDCLPDVGWIRAGADAFEPGVGVVCGPITPAQLTPDEPFFVHQIHAVTREEGLYPTANVFYRREAFLALGGFDETLRTYAWGQPVGGDDTEMAWRAKRAGHRSVFAPEAGVLHQASPVSMREYMLNSVQAQVLPRMVASFPELRRTALYKRVFVHKQSAQFWLLLGGLGMARASRFALLLGIPWLRSIWPMVMVDTRPRRRWPRAGLRILFQFQASLLLAATLVYSSIKHREPVL